MGYIQIIGIYSDHLLVLPYSEVNELNWSKTLQSKYIMERKRISCLESHMLTLSAMSFSVF